jgi:hypothetical protein
MQLWRTVCSTDWKGRPHHSLTLIAESDKTDRLIERQNEDVAEWQALDIRNHNENLEDGEEKTTEWAIERYRWEMDLDAKLSSRSSAASFWSSALREFVEGSEGHWTTTVYHLVG